MWFILSVALVYALAPAKFVSIETRWEPWGTAILLPSFLSIVGDWANLYGASVSRSLGT